MLARKEDVDHSVDIATVMFEELNPNRLHIWSGFPDRLDDGRTAWTVNLGPHALSEWVTFEEAWRLAEAVAKSDHIQESLS